MDGPRRSERKRNQTDFLEATETRRDARRSGRGDEAQAKASRAHEAAVGNAYEPLGGLVQLGAVGGEGRVWVGEPGEGGAEDSPALDGFAPSPADDLDSGLFDLADRHCYCCMLFFDGAGGSKVLLEGGHRWCMQCSYHVHGDRRGNGGQQRGGQHPEFATTARPNDRCPAGCSGCTGCTAGLAARA
jgi:hypothetical protein